MPYFILRLYRAGDDDAADALQRCCDIWMMYHTASDGLFLCLRSAGVRHRRELANASSGLRI